VSSVESRASASYGVGRSPYTARSTQRWTHRRTGSKATAMTAVAVSESATFGLAVTPMASPTPTTTIT
jgi:hypothetical protein